MADFVTKLYEERVKSLVAAYADRNKRKPTTAPSTISKAPVEAKPAPTDSETADQPATDEDVSTATNAEEKKSDARQSEAAKDDLENDERKDMDTTEVTDKTEEGC